jgi:hypothetical protein
MLGYFLESGKYDKLFVGTLAVLIKIFFGVSPDECWCGTLKGRKESRVLERGTDYPN